jgi:hypothetical protein
MNRKCRFRGGNWVSENDLMKLGGWRDNKPNLFMEKKFTNVQG